VPQSALFIFGCFLYIPVMPQSKFDDIRPYYDQEVTEVLQRVINDKEFIDAVSKFVLPRVTALMPWLVKPLVKAALSWQTRKVVDVYSFQQVVEKYMRHMITQTTTQLTHSGLERLDQNQSYLFISNHRDIAMDPAFVNWILYHNGMDTVRIAIGDNLLTKPYASDLMRLNKSFLVKRSETAPRKIFAALKNLSAYIGFSIKEESANVWIAQREGRAKDGNDRTEPAMIKMIAMAKPKTMEFADYIKGLRIVPVSISYEWDPCDEAKARELHAKRTHGSYEKDTHEDVQSIANGIAGHKGHVHVAFGDVLEGDFEDAEQVAEELDRQILSNYYLHPSNYLAYQQDHSLESLPEKISAMNSLENMKANTAAFSERLQQCQEDYRDILIAMYANPVLSKD